MLRFLPLLAAVFLCRCYDATDVPQLAAAPGKADTSSSTFGSTLKVADGNYVYNMRLSPDGKQLLLAGGSSSSPDAGIVEGWDLQGRTLLFQLAHPGVTQVLATEAPERLLSFSGTEIRVWAPGPSGELQQTATVTLPKRGSVLNAETDAKEQLLVFTAMDYFGDTTAYLLDLKSLTLKEIDRSEYIYKVRISPDNSTVMLLTGEQVKFWDLAKRAPSSLKTISLTSRAHAAIFLDNDRILVGTYTGKAFVYRLPYNVILASYAMQPWYTISRVVQDPTRHRVALGGSVKAGGGGEIALYQGPSHVATYTPESATQLLFTPDGKYLLSSGWGTVSFWPIPAGKH